MFAEIAFPLRFRQVFTYKIPEQFRQFITIGRRVKAPFGGRTMIGYVLRLTDTPAFEELSKIKEITSFVDAQPLFDEDILKFYEWMAEHYLSDIGEVLRLADPYATNTKVEKKIVAEGDMCTKLYDDEKDKSSGRAKLLRALSEKGKLTLSQAQTASGSKNLTSILKTLEKIGAVTIITGEEKAKVREKRENFVLLELSAEEVYERIPEIENSSPKQVDFLLRLIKMKKKEASLAAIIKETGVGRESIKSLAKKGFIKIISKRIERRFDDTFIEKVKDITLTDPQSVVVNSVTNDVKSKSFSVSLLHGVTGSGKTQVYLEIIRNTLEMGKTALILVPEISLTPQMTARLRGMFGSKVAVLHSRMSQGERFDSWQNIFRGDIKVVTGPRSALFAPLRNIGVVIVDEEHDSSYKQSDVTPKYHARDAAIMKAKIIGCPVLLGSATPAIESMYNAELGKYKLLELKTRVDSATLPVITLVNVIEEKKKKMMENVFSKVLLEKIADRIRKKEGVIILQNRRGYSTQVYCFECGEPEVCVNCSVAMVYHINQNILQCHYCGYTAKRPTSCNHCGSKAIKYFGFGTERVEEELEYYFPNAQIRRIDSDTISRKGELGTILNDFAKGEVDVLVGTQMVSKGLDFSRVSLVGVLSAESSLWMPDFRADERTFQLLTQVAGRAGRSTIPGEVMIQTQNDTNFILRKVQEYDYTSFFEKEKLTRERNSYPPFAHLCLIEVRHTDEQKLKEVMANFYNFLNKYRKFLVLSMPAFAVVAKVNKEYRMQMLARTVRKTDPSGLTLRKIIKEANEVIERDNHDSRLRIVLDVNPYSVL